jgi:hypothetical protein
LAAPDTGEEQYYEWCRMLMEDRPEHSALCVAEAAGDGWDEQLRASVAPVAFATPSRSSANSQGLKRLDSELHGICTKERMQRATSGDSLRRLAEEGPWRLAFGEIYEAFQLVQQLRERNDALARELAALRWHRLMGYLPTSVPARYSMDVSNADAVSVSSRQYAPSPSPTCGSRLFATAEAPTAASASAMLPRPRRPLSAPSSSRYACAPALPAAPRFESPVTLLTASRAGASNLQQPCDSSVASGKVLGWAASDESLTLSSMPKAVVTDTAEWEATGRSAKRETGSGLAYLLGARSAAERFRPGGALPAGFGTPKLCDTPASPASTQCVEQPDYPKPRRPKGAAEMAREQAAKAAAKFAEPLNAALGGAASNSALKQQGGRSRSSSRTRPPATAAMEQRPKKSTAWVTFMEPSPPESAEAVREAAASAAPAAPSSTAALSEPCGGCAGLSAPGVDGFAALDTVADAFSQDPASGEEDRRVAPTSGSTKGWADDVEFGNGGAGAFDFA